MKILAKAVIIAVVFFLTWSAFDRVDWMNLLNVDEVTESTEEMLGDLIWKSIETTESIVTNDETVKLIDRMVTRITDANGIDRSALKLHVVRNGQVNAFALPNGHIIVYTGLIAACDSPDELAGVIAHEIAHVEQRHVMNKLAKEFGMAVLMSIGGGNAGGEVARQIAKTLSSSAYDRTLEAEADRIAVKYLGNADIRPDGLADFLYKRSLSDGDTERMLSWISTHPESSERAKVIIELATKGSRTTPYTPSLDREEWDRLKSVSRL